MNIKPQTLKGFRDFMPLEAKKRQYTIQIFKNIFEKFGFEPLETPALEYEELLMGKYGEEGDKLMYRFEDLGKRKVALRYDQTVPLARVISQYQNQLVFPFKRYQISPVWRAEKTQKGRFREFFQCDADIVGSTSILSDAETILITINTFKKLGFKNFKILINDRKIFKNLSIQTVTILDKLKKIGTENVCQELADKKIFDNNEKAREFLNSTLNQKPTELIIEIINELEMLGVDKSLIEFSPTLARGLNYYTGMIFETEIPEYPYGSLASGGRYDNLIGIFTDKQIPAVGLAFGFDRIIDAMSALNLFPPELNNSTSQVLITIFSPELKKKSLEITRELQAGCIKSEIYLGELKEKNSLEKQLKYADQKGIQYIIIIGPEEYESNTLTLKNMRTKKQQRLTLNEAQKILKTEL